MTIDLSGDEQPHVVLVDNNSCEVKKENKNKFDYILILIIGDRQKHALANPLPQWNALEVKPFWTVSAIKGVALKDICKDEEGEQVITCSAFEDTIVEVNV